MLYLHHVASEIASGQLDLTFKPFSGDGGVYGVLIKMVSNLKAKIAEADSKSQQAEQQAKAAQEATVLAEACDLGNKFMLKLFKFICYII